METLRVAGLLFWIGVLGTCDLHAERREAARRSKVTVVVCDRAGIDAKTRLAAKAETIRILASGEVGLTWIDSDHESEGSSRFPLDSVEHCTLPPLQTYLFIQILPRRPKDIITGIETMGAAPGTTGPYRRAYVFFDHVKDFAQVCMSSPGATAGVILGHAIAHELGHLLIPGRAHSPYGIMRDRWGAPECLRVASGNMLFDRPIPF